MFCSTVNDIRLVFRRQFMREKIMHWHDIAYMLFNIQKSIVNSPCLMSKIFRSFVSQGRYAFVKVFRFQGKTLFLFYCFFFSSLIFSFSYRFCAEDFSKSAGSIFMKFSGLIDNHNNLIYFFYFDDITSGFEKSEFFSVLYGLVVRNFQPNLKATKLQLYQLN